VTRVVVGVGVEDTVSQLVWRAGEESRQRVVRVVVVAEQLVVVVVVESVCSQEESLKPSVCSQLPSRGDQSTVKSAKSTVQ
jgi:hypothetical protein